MVEILNRRSRVRRVLVVVALAGLMASALAGNAYAASPVLLGTADSFALLAGSTITNTGPTTITGDIGLCCTGTATTGFGSVTQPGGAQYAGPSTAAAVAQDDLDIAYGDAAGRPVTRTLPVDLSLSGTPAMPLLPGVYDSTAHGVLQINTGLTLDFQGDPNAVFIFQGTTLTTASAAAGSVTIVNGGSAPSPCNIFWQLSSDTTGVTLGTGSAFKGTTMALGASVLGTGATVQGRVLTRRSKAVTLDTNTITRTACATVTPTDDTTTTTTPGSTTTPSTTTTTTPSTTTTTPGGGSTTPGGETATTPGGGTATTPGGGTTNTPGDATGGDDTSDEDSGDSTADEDSPTATSTDSGGGGTDTGSGDASNTPGLPLTGQNVVWMLFAASALLLAGLTLRGFDARR